MYIVGLTGSIGMGKSTAARMLRRFGIPVHDADATVHALMAEAGSAIVAVREVFPSVVVDDAVDRRALAAIVFNDRNALDRLQAILHPMVRQAETRFLAACGRHRRRLVVLDIPLLYETGAEQRLDAVIVVSAPGRLQAIRVLRRPGMTPDRLDAIRSRQMPDALKRRRADWVIETGLGHHVTCRALRRVVRRLLHRSRPGGRRAWSPGHGATGHGLARLSGVAG